MVMGRENGERAGPEVLKRSWSTRMFQGVLAPLRVYVGRAVFGLFPVRRMD
jgi:hypothetical protein